MNRWNVGQYWEQWTRPMKTSSTVPLRLNNCCSGAIHLSLTSCQVIYPKAFSFPIGHTNAFSLPIGPLYRLLDLLSAEPRWGEGDVCEECQVLLWHILNFSCVSFNLWKHGKYSLYTQHRPSLDWPQEDIIVATADVSSVPSAVPRRCRSSSTTSASRSSWLLGWKSKILELGLER